MRGEQLEAPVGTERVAFPGEHPGRVLALPLEGEHARGEREVTRQVLLPQEPQQFAVVGVTRQCHPRDHGAGQRLAAQLGVQLAVAYPHDLLITRVRRHHGRPALQEPGARIADVRPRPFGQRSHGPGRYAGPFRTRLAVAGRCPAVRSRRRRFLGRQLGGDGGQLLQAAGRRHLPGGLRVVVPHGRGDPGQVPDPRRRDDRRRAGGRPAHRGRQHTLGEVQAMAAQQPGQVLVESGNAVVVEGGGAGPEDGHVLGPCAERVPVADQLAGHVAEGVGAATPLELVDRHHVGEVQHVDLFQLGRRAELGCHHVQRDVGQRHDRRVALPDPRRLQDHQVVTGRLAGADDGLDAVRQLVGAPGGQRPEEEVVAVEGVHPDPVAEQRPAAAPVGRVDGQHRHAQLVLLVGAEPPDQLIGQRRLA